MSVSLMNPPQPMPLPLFEDPLAFLPRRTPQFFQKDRRIYSPEDPSDSIFLVVDGTVKLSRIADSGRETVLDFIGRDSFFGESALLRKPYRGEMAAALENCSIMEWRVDELATIMIRTPELGPAMLRVMAQKIFDADRRIESLAIDQIVQRLVKALLSLGDRFGTREDDRPQVHLMPVTHELLARYVGTSREIITQHMSQLRRKGLVTYSRSGLEFSPIDLKRYLGEHTRH